MRPARSLVEITACSRSIAACSCFDDDPPPDAPPQIRDRAERLGLEQDLALVDDGHARAQLTHVVDDVGGEQNDAVLTQLAQQVEESDAFGRVEPRGGFVDDHQRRIA